MSRHREAARELRSIAVGLRLLASQSDGERKGWALGCAAVLDRTAATMPHHRMILVPDVARPPAYLLVHADAADNWQSLTMWADKAEAQKAKMKRLRHWRALRAKGMDV